MKKTINNREIYTQVIWVYMVLLIAISTTHAQIPQLEREFRLAVF